MAERELAILLTAKDLASRGIQKVTGNVNKLGGAGHRAGAGLKTLGKGAAIAGAGIATFLGASIHSGLESLQEREDVISATAGAIKSTGGAAKVSAAQVRTWAEELENATDAFVDDKAIQAAENNLLRFTGVSGKLFHRVITDAVDLGAALKTGPEAAAKTLGKALDDPLKGMTALRKAGVILSIAEQKRVKALVKAGKTEEAQIALLEAVEKRYKGAAAAAGGPYTDAINKVADVTEDARMALAVGFLPLLTKVADKLSKGLSDPKTMGDIEGFGRGLAGTFEAVLGAASKIPWGSIRDAMVLTGQGAKAALGFFTGLPPWVQTAVLTGWGLNKLTGGAVTGIVGELGKGLIKGVLGMNAGVVNIKAGVVTGAGGGLPPTGPTKPGKGSDFFSWLARAIPLVLVSDIGGTPDPRSGDPDLPPAIDNLNLRIFELQRRIEELSRRNPNDPAFPGGTSGITSAQEIAKLNAQISALRAQTNTSGIQTRQSIIGGFGGLRQTDSSLAYAQMQLQRAGTSSEVTAANAIRTATDAAGRKSAAAGSQVSSAVERKKTSVTFAPTIVTRVSVRETIKTQTTFKKYGMVAS